MVAHVLGSGQPVVAVRVAALFDVAWAPPVVLGVVLPRLLLPDGHLRSRRWRYAVGVVGTGAATFVVADLLAPHELSAFPDLDNPFGLGAGPATWPSR